VLLKSTWWGSFDEAATGALCSVDSRLSLRLEPAEIPLIDQPSRAAPKSAPGRFRCGAHRLTASRKGKGKGDRSARVASRSRVADDRAAPRTGEAYREEVKGIGGRSGAGSVLVASPGERCDRESSRDRERIGSRPFACRFATSCRRVGRLISRLAALIARGRSGRVPKVEHDPEGRGTADRGSHRGLQPGRKGQVDAGICGRRRHRENLSLA